jgi:tRNA(Arg) A34 adenosine deaminase TadA
MPTDDEPPTTGRTDPMRRALDLAAEAAGAGEVPVGAVVVDASGTIVAEARNRTRELCDPTAHAEMLAIRAACAARGSQRLPGHDLHVTLEPCPMCAAAISFARIRRLYFGADDPKSGGVHHGPRIYAHPTCHHAPDVHDGIAAAEAAALLRTFFAGLRR